MPHLSKKCNFPVLETGVSKGMYTFRYSWDQWFRQTYWVRLPPSSSPSSSLFATLILINNYHLSAHLFIYVCIHLSNLTKNTGVNIVSSGANADKSKSSHWKPKGYLLFCNANRGEKGKAVRRERHHLFLHVSRYPLSKAGKGTCFILDSYTTDDHCTQLDWWPWLANGAW